MDATENNTPANTRGDFTPPDQSIDVHDEAINSSSVGNMVAVVALVAQPVGLNAPMNIKGDLVDLLLEDQLFLTRLKRAKT